MDVICAICYSRLLSHSRYLNVIHAKDIITLTVYHLWLKMTAYISIETTIIGYAQNVHRTYFRLIIMTKTSNIFILWQLFMPFEYSETDFTHLLDFDPDMNFCQNWNNNCINKCDYYYEDSINKKCKELDINKHHLSLLHNNLRSIPHNLDHFNQFLNGLDIDFSFLAFSETWLKPHNEHCYGVNDNAEYNSRLNKAGGGVSLCIKQGIEYNKRSELQFTRQLWRHCLLKLIKRLLGVLIISSLGLCTARIIQM